MAEGDELGSNTLRVGQSSPEGTRGIKFLWRRSETSIQPTSTAHRPGGWRNLHCEGPSPGPNRAVAEPPD
jgi:hypothetical protein